MQQTNGATTIRLPQKDGSLTPYTLSEPRSFERQAKNGAFNRIAFSAAHVVSDPLAEVDPWLDAAIDWDATIAYREYIWDLGLGVAEAMDTAQRGMGLDWTTSLELIRRSVEAARPRNGLVFSGAGTDQLTPNEARNLDDVIAAYEDQIAAIEKIGGRIILMASRALAAVARGRDDALIACGAGTDHLTPGPDVTIDTIIRLAISAPVTLPSVPKTTATNAISTNT